MPYTLQTTVNVVPGELSTSSVIAELNDRIAIVIPTIPYDYAYLWAIVELSAFSNQIGARLQFSQWEMWRPAIEIRSEVNNDLQVGLYFPDKTYPFTGLTAQVWKFV